MIPKLKVFRSNQRIGLSPSKIATLVAMFCILSFILSKQIGGHQSYLQVMTSRAAEYVNWQRNTNKTIDNLQLRFENRRKRVQDTCNGKKGYCGFISNFKFHQYKFFEYNTTVCPIAKAGSSTWRAHLRRVNNGPPFHLPIYQDIRKERFLNRSVEVILEDILSSSKIITVRHPFTRLVSAYRNKYKFGKVMSKHRPEKEAEIRGRLAGSNWDDRFYQFWLPALWANYLVPSDTHLKVGLRDPVNPDTRYNVSVYHKLYDVLKPKISFSQFLIYVIKTLKDGKPDAHWSQYHRTCCPCFYDYDYITKVETMTEDLKYVFKVLGIPADPATSMNQHRDSVSYVYGDLKYFQNVPMYIKKEIYRFYKSDMDMFGYQLPEDFFQEHPFTRLISSYRNEYQNGRVIARYNPERESENRSVLMERPEDGYQSPLLLPKLRSRPCIFGCCNK